MKNLSFVSSSSELSPVYKMCFYFFVTEIILTVEQQCFLTLVKQFRWSISRVLFQTYELNLFSSGSISTSLCVCLQSPRICNLLTIGDFLNGKRELKTISLPICLVVLLRCTRPANVKQASRGRSLPGYPPRFESGYKYAYYLGCPSRTVQVLGWCKIPLWFSCYSESFSNGTGSKGYLWTWPRLCMHWINGG